jgi:predicted transcriptional regulator of viral defense system
MYIYYSNMPESRVFCGRPGRVLARDFSEGYILGRTVQTEQGADHVLVTGRERSFVDCLLFLDYSGGLEELDKSLAMFPSFDVEAALAYLKLLRSPWLYSRLGFLLDRHADTLFFRGKARDRFLQKLPRGVAYLADKRPGQRWVPTWKLTVPETFSPSQASPLPT